jgi:hypothetical protein
MDEKIANNAKLKAKDRNQNGTWKYKRINSF